MEDELCVCDVATIIGSSVATASHHLRYLKDNNLARSHRKGKQMYYSLADEHVYQIVTIAYEHAKEGLRMATTPIKQEYRLQNLSCASCAAKFEKNVKAIPEVQDAQVNFGASKITVIGAISVDQIEEAGAFDGIKVTQSAKALENTTPFIVKGKRFSRNFIAFVILGYLFAGMNGESSPLPISMFIIAILVGGVGILK